MQCILPKHMNQFCQETLSELPPDHQLGFRRFLAAIYIHTSSHVVAAPMAHYLALNSSRFLFSHDTCYLPVHSIDNFIKDNNMVMKFQKINGKQVPVHDCMNYIYRAKEFEDTCFYQFFQEMNFISKSMAEKENRECFFFTDDHPCQSEKVTIYREKKCVPIAPWNWLGSTKTFTTSMFNEVSTQDPDYEKKEKYAYKFMVMFLPFRLHDDLILQGSYQMQWQKSYREGQFSDSMIQIAQNIQNIHNSLESSIAVDNITLETDLQDVENGSEETENIDEDHQNLLDSIGELFAMSSTDSILTEEPKIIDPQYDKSDLDETLFNISDEPEIDSLNSVIEFETDEENGNTCNQEMEKNFVILRIIPC